MDNATAAPSGSTSREAYWERVQVLRAELDRLRPAGEQAPHRPGLS